MHKHQRNFKRHSVVVSCFCFEQKKFSFLKSQRENKQKRPNDIYHVLPRENDVHMLKRSEWGTLTRDLVFPYIWYLRNGTWCWNECTYTIKWCDLLQIILFLLLLFASNEDLFTNHDPQRIATFQCCLIDFGHLGFIFYFLSWSIMQCLISLRFIRGLILLKTFHF